MVPLEKQRSHSIQSVAISFTEMTHISEVTPILIQKYFKNELQKMPKPPRETQARLRKEQVLRSD